MTDASILLVEDEKLHRMTLEDNLRGAGYEVLSVASGQEALDLLPQHNFAVALLDIYLPDITGIDLFYLLRERQPQCSVILMTGQSSVEAAVTAMREGAYDYLAKPFAVELLLVRIERALQLHRLHQQLSAAEPGEIPSRSPHFQKLLQACQVAAKTPATILLLGESGVGKERLANFIHSQSPRAKGALIKVNCAAIPETLLEGELFGYCKGAYTGAQRDHEGLLLQANGGSLFLDEIGEIPLAMQVKLLRVLQERRLRRLGDEKERAVDFRLIAATHQDVRELVRQGRLREDFYYRINVIPLSVPPLRERREDLSPLVAQLIQSFARRYQQPPILLTPEVFDCLENYAFPGNIRELRNLLERLQVLYAGKMIHVRDLPAEYHQTQANHGELIHCFATHLPLRQASKEFERRFIQIVLDEEQGNRTLTAARLGISRKNLWEKLQEG